MAEYTNDSKEVRGMANVYVNERSIMLSDDITEETVGIIINAILKINQEDGLKEQIYADYVRDPIYLYINTGGGLCYDALGLMDVMATSQTPIYTFAMGKCMSAGLHIFLAGSQRYCMKNTTFMYHNLSHTLSGIYGKLVEEMEEDMRLEERMDEWVMARCKITPKMISDCKKNKSNIYIDAETAKKLQIVNSIIGEKSSIYPTKKA